MTYDRAELKSEKFCLELQDHQQTTSSKLNTSTVATQKKFLLITECTVMICDGHIKTKTNQNILWEKKLIYFPTVRHSKNVYRNQNPTLHPVSDMYTQQKQKQTTSQGSLEEKTLKFVAAVEKSSYILSIYLLPRSSTIAVALLDVGFVTSIPLKVCCIIW